MKKILLSLVAPFIAFALSAAGIGTTSHEEADAIVLKRLSQETRPYTLHATEELQKEMRITSSAGELLEINYWCWVYYVSYTGTNQGLYLIVKEANGKLLEVQAQSDVTPDDLAEWKQVGDGQSDCEDVIISSEKYENWKEYPSLDVWATPIGILVGDCLKLRINSRGCDPGRWIVKLIDSEVVSPTSPPGVATRQLRFYFDDRGDFIENCNGGEYDYICCFASYKDVSFNLKGLQVEGVNTLHLNIPTVGVVFYKY